MEKQKITLDGEYTTRDGKEVRIYAVDAGGSHPVHGAVKSFGKWKAQAWSKHGKSTRNYFNLIPKKKTKKVWIAIAYSKMLERVIANVYDSLEELKENFDNSKGWAKMEVIEREYEI